MKQSPPSGLQTWIHFWEEGRGHVWIKNALAVLFFAMVSVLYHVYEAGNFTSPEAMDQGQVARNFVEGRGFTTLNLQPFALHLLRRGMLSGQTNETILSFRRIPDIANAPVYPLVWAGLMFDLPDFCRYTRMSGIQALHRPVPEMAIGGLNFAIFVVSAWLVYQLAERLSGPSAAAVATVFFLGSDMMWRFAFSGLSTHLVVLELLVLVTLIVARDDSSGAAKWTGWRAGLWAVGIGLLLGLIGLTRYSMCWLAIPTAIWIFNISNRRGFLWSAMAVAAFVLTLSPWLARNWNLSHAPFGTATYAVFAETAAFPGLRLERSQNPQLPLTMASEVLAKTGRNVLSILKNEFPSMGGSWSGVFFFIGALLPVQDDRLRRFRLWVMGTLPLLLIIEAGTRTRLDELSPEINSNNLLALLFPVLSIFGAIFLERLLKWREFPFPLAQHLTRLGMVTWPSLPLLCSMAYAGLVLLGLVPRAHSVVGDPAYQPAYISTACRWTPEGSLLMSDIPWATAWYGEREALWMPLHVRDDSGEDFFSIHLRQRLVKAVLLSPMTTNGRFQEDFLANADQPWGGVFLNILFRSQLPEGFPLTFIESELLKSGYCFVAAAPWWKQEK